MLGFLFITKGNLTNDIKMFMQRYLFPRSLGDGTNPADHGAIVIGKRQSDSVAKFSNLGPTPFERF